MLIKLAFTNFDYTIGEYMKTIVSNLCGQRHITARDKNAKLFQIKQVLNTHRNLLLDKVSSDISYYVNVRYQVYATPEEQAEIRRKILGLKDREINLSNYLNMVEEIKRKKTTKLSNTAFYDEIDEVLLGPHFRKFVALG